MFAGTSWFLPVNVSFPLKRPFKNLYIWKIRGDLAREVATQRRCKVLVSEQRSRSLWGILKFSAGAGWRRWGWGDVREFSFLEGLERILSFFCGNKTYQS